MSLSRQQRRAAERASRKAERRQLAVAAAPALGFVSHEETPHAASPLSEARLEANRANAHLSTGPRTVEGKAKSRENSFKHGLYSKQLVLKGEDPSDLAALKTTLFNEHQPATETEALLVQEVAEHYWLMKRYRRFETHFLNLDLPQPRQAEAAQRMHGRSERSFYKALKTLRELQKERSTRGTGLQPVASFHQKRLLPGNGSAVSTGHAVSTGFVPAGSAMPVQTGAANMAPTITSGPQIAVSAASPESATL